MLFGWSRAILLQLAHPLVRELDLSGRDDRIDEAVRDGAAVVVHEFVARVVDAAHGETVRITIDQRLLQHRRPRRAGRLASTMPLWRVHSLDRILREAWEAGCVMTGASAGMNCWFEASVTDSFGPLAPLHDGLGLLLGSACPHYDSEPERRPTYLRLVAEGFPPGYAAEDSVALNFRDGERGSPAGFDLHRQQHAGFDPSRQPRHTAQSTA